MVPIKHILYENGVEEIFKFIVPSGNYQGEYVIEKPTGWDDVDSIIDIDDELFFVKNFIIGENTKLKLYQYANKSGFDIIDKVYEEQKGDGRIIFKWIGVKDNIEYDLLKDNMEVNLNKYNKSFGNSMFIIEVEIIKSEAENKLFTRDDVTIDLFSNKDLDENVIDPVQTFEIGYKKGAAKRTNFYYWDTSQSHVNLNPRTDHFFSFVRSDQYEFGNNTNEYCGIKNLPDNTRVDQGPFVRSDVTLKSIKIEISNMHVIFERDNNIPVTPEVYLCAIVSGPGYFYSQKLKKSTQVPGTYGSEINITNEIFTFINFDNSSDLPSGLNLSFLFLTETADDKYVVISIKLNTSIEINTYQESPLVQTKGVRIIDALNQIVKNYTSSKLNVTSDYIGPGGVFYNSSISTGVYLRGLPDLYTVGQKIKTSLKSLITDGVAKLLALGYDVFENTVVIEDIAYFFKDKVMYDLSDKIYLREGFKIIPDKDVTFNTLIFGSKKYSKNVKEDIKNFITSAEFSTPITSIKNKFDKQTEIIIDEYKIQELIEDQSSSTNDNDDDLVLIDLIHKNNYWDTGIFDNCRHFIKEGKLALSSFGVAFSSTMIKVGSQVEITEGINKGTYSVLAIDGAEMILNKTTGIQEGYSDTPIKYLIVDLIKNRSITDSFTDIEFVRDPVTSTNSRHNPKYHMARWFSWFGSGLISKSDEKLIKVTNYKNNSKAKMRADGADITNELGGEIVVGADETLFRLRAYYNAFFTGDIIEISFANVTFKEFIILYESWRYGVNGDRINSRGYIKLNTPLGPYDVYPFGNGAFSHDRKTNVLSIKGKIRGKRQ